jgi:hypothetical protein
VVRGRDLVTNVVRSAETKKHLEGLWQAYHDGKASLKDTEKSVVPYARSYRSGPDRRLAATLANWTGEDEASLPQELQDWSAWEFNAKTGEYEYHGSMPRIDPAAEAGS